MNPRIEDVLGGYEHKHDGYIRLAELAAGLLYDELKRAGVPGIVSSPANNFASIRDNLIARERAGTLAGAAGYLSSPEIETELRELATARVALYFPDDMRRVNKLVAEHFDAIEPARVFPVETELRDLARARATPGYPRSVPCLPHDTPEAGQPVAEHFDAMEPARRSSHDTRGAFLPHGSGYTGTHHRVRMRRARLTSTDECFASDVCEVRVASVLMHAWAEVQHDLDYARTEGVEPPAHLSGYGGVFINGFAGELERLQDALTLRELAVQDHYELGTWLLGVAVTTGASRRAVGDVAVAYRFLRLLDCTQYSSLCETASALVEVLATDKQKPLSDALLDVLLREDPTRSEMLQMAKREAAAVVQKVPRLPRSNRPSFATLARDWQEVEPQLGLAHALATRTDGRGPTTALVSALGLDDNRLSVLEQLTSFWPQRSTVVPETSRLSELEDAAFSLLTETFDKVVDAVELTGTFEVFGGHVGVADALPLGTTIAVYGDAAGLNPDVSLTEIRIHLRGITFWPCALLKRDTAWRTVPWTKIHSSTPLVGPFAVAFDVGRLAMDSAERLGIDRVELTTKWEQRGGVADVRTPMRLGTGEDHCSFCGNPLRDVGMLAVAPERPYRICDECIAVCLDILAAGDGDVQSGDWACSFCDTARSDAGKLISGPNVFICDVCVAKTSELMTARRSG